MNIPPGFAEQFAVVSERWEWANQRGADFDLQSSKLLVEDFSLFLERWYGKTGVPELQTDLLDIANWVINLKNRFDVLSLSSFYETVEACRRWAVAELLVKSTKELRNLRDLCPPELLAALDQPIRAALKGELDPSTQFRELEAYADECERAYRQALAKYQEDWPERVYPSDIKRLKKRDPQDLTKWAEELARVIPSYQERADHYLSSK